MLVATAVFWMCIIVLSASGVYSLWTGMVKARIVNIVLLPGTLIAQLGHILGTLITGGTVEGTALVSDDESGAPKQTAPAKSRIPVVGPLIVGVLPLLMCGVGIVLSTSLLGGPTVDDLATGKVATSLPKSVPAFWDLLHNTIDLMEKALSIASHAGAAGWKAWLFIYLLICLTVRMAPQPGNLRGALTAIASLGIIAFLTSLAYEPTKSAIESGWNLLSLTATTLLLLLLLSAVIRGCVDLSKTLFHRL